MVIGVMIDVPSKRLYSTPLIEPLRALIDNQCSDINGKLADRLDGDLKDLHGLFNCSQSNELDRRLADLVRHLLVVAALDRRVKSGADSNLRFDWCDAFKSNVVRSSTSLRSEMAAVVFNLGSVYSKIGALADRALPVGLKKACASFQSAAGAFEFLKDEVGENVIMAGVNVDVSVECAGMLERVMLAQAQECFFEKVVDGGKAPALCSKIAQQVSLYYEEANKDLNAAPLSQHFDMAWKSHIRLKAAQFFAEACYRYSLMLHNKEEIGEEIARLRIGLRSLNDAKNSAKGVCRPVLDAVNKLEINMNNSLDRALKENNQIYFTRIPTAESLGSLPAASLVKSTSLKEIMKASKTNYFSYLIPKSCTAQASLYSNMVDNIIQIQVEKLKKRSESTKAKLLELNLPYTLQELEGNFSLPADLRERVELVLLSGRLSELEVELRTLRDSKSGSEKLLVQAEKLLQEEAGLKPSSLTEDRQTRISCFASKLKDRADRDEWIENEVKLNLEMMLLLDCKLVESAFPNLATPIISLDSNKKAVVRTLKKNLMELDNLIAEGCSFEDRLNEIKKTDDLIPKLLELSGSEDDLYREEITKYDKICQEIAENIASQKNLLDIIQEQNEELDAASHLQEYKVACEECFKKITECVVKCQKVTENIIEAKKFHDEFQDELKKMNTRVVNKQTTGLTRLLLLWKQYKLKGISTEKSDLEATSEQSEDQKSS